MQFGPDKAGRISSHGIFFDGKSGICLFFEDKSFTPASIELLKSPVGLA